MQGHYRNCVSPSNCWCEVKRYGNLIALGAVIFTLETAGGYYSGSLSLYADAWHVFVCNGMYTTAALATVMVRYGKASYKKAERGASVALALGLFIIISVIMYQAFERLSNPPEVTSATMMVVAFIGGILNWRQQRVHHGAADEHKGHKHRLAALHILSDKWQSWAVAFGGALKLMSESVWPRSSLPAYIDPILSIAIAIFLIAQIIMATEEYLKKQSRNNVDQH